jgi:hypothetical protein
MLIVFLKMDLGPGFTLYYIGLHILSQPWLWITAAIVAYFGSEIFRANRRQTGQALSAANPPPKSRTVIRNASILKRSSIVAVVASCSLIAGLNLSGFCYSHLSYLSSQELYKAAVLDQANKLAGMPEHPGLRDGYAIGYLRSHPHCCSILRNHVFGSSLFADLFGYKYFLVRVVYELSEFQVEAAPKDGKFYEAFVEVAPCGKVIRARGSRLEEWPPDLI